jgi:hypothetical protein
MRYARYCHSTIVARLSRCVLSVQTDIVAVQRVYYNQRYNFGCKYSLDNGTVCSRCVLRHHTSMVVLVDNVIRPYETMTLQTNGCW